jgi:hypothetical protein
MEVSLWFTSVRCPERVGVKGRRRGSRRGGGQREVREASRQKRSAAVQLEMQGCDGGGDGGLGQAGQLAGWAGWFWAGTGEKII